MTYLDSSALIKRFVAEAGSEVVRGLFVDGARMATSKIAYAEVHAALARRQRDGSLTLEGYRGVAGEFDRDWPAYVQIELRDDVLILVRHLVRRHPLRGLAAIRLASALYLRDAANEAPTFFASDERLLAAARAERLRTFNPEAS
jgi:predicted nucleic acid-binding protein